MDPQLPVDQNVINVDQTQPIVEDTINVDTGPSPTTPKPMSAELANLRGTKMHFAAGKMLGLSEEEIKADLMAGKEEQLRLEASSKLERQKEEFFQKQITEISQKKGGPLTPEEVSHIKVTIDALTKGTNTETVFEELYSKEYLDLIHKTGDVNPDTFLYEAKREIPQQVNQLLAAGATAAQYREFAVTKQQNAQEVVKEQSWLGWGADVGKMMFPFYADVKQRGSVTGTGFFDGGLLGENSEVQARAILRLPFDQFTKEFNRIYNKLLEDNPMLAVEFAQTVAGQSTSDIQFKNLFNLIDATTLPWIKGGKAGAKKLGLYNDTRRAVEQVARSSGSPEVNAVVRNEAVGEIGEAAVHKATADMINDLRGTSDMTRRAIEALPKGLRLDSELVGQYPANLSREGVLRIQENIHRAGEGILNILKTGSRVETLPEILQVENATRLVHDHVKGLYPGLENRILDVSPPIKEPISNTWTYNVEFGTTGADYFTSRKVAKNFAREAGFSEANIVDVDQQGLKFKVVVNSKPIDQNDPIFRGIQLTTKESEAMDSFLNFYGVGKYRTPEEVLSLDQRMNRKVSTYAPSKIIEVMLEARNEIQNLANWRGVPFSPSRKRWKEFNELLEAQQKITNPDTNKPGYFAKHPQELQEMYMTHFGRGADEDEVAAYFSFKTFTELDWVMRNVALVRNKLRVGVEQHTFHTRTPEGKSKISTPSLEGILLKELPGGEDMGVFIGKDGKITVKFMDHLNTHLKGDWLEGVKTGRYKVIRIFDPELKPLNSFSPETEGKRIRYVIGENLETKPISWDQLPRQGAGHIEYDYDFYIKQAKVLKNSVGDVFKHIYEGDTTIMPVNIRAKAIDIANKLDKIRLLIRDKKMDEAKAFSEEYLPMEWKEVKGWFEPRHFDGEKLPAHLDLYEPIQVVGKNEMIVNMDNNLGMRYPGTFRDGTRQGSDARQYQVQYTGQRDAYELFTLNDAGGTRQKPLYDVAPAKMVSPIPSMNRALSRITHSHFMDDYKTFAVERWLREASPWLKTESHTDSEIKHAPFAHFHGTNGVPEFVSNVPINIRTKLEAEHHHIRQLLGISSKTEALIHTATRTLADAIWKSKIPIDPDWVLPTLTDPFRVIRSLTFHAKLGLFAIPQFIVQNQTWTSIYAISGYKYASSGSYATLLHQWSRVNKNPEFLAKLDEYASRLNLPGTSRWKPGEFKEAMSEGHKTGMFNVGGEYALLDNPVNHKVITNGLDTFLDAGTFAFREGERNVRIGAWYTAYREFRDKNPVGRITDRERDAILERADLLTINMTRASSSKLHTGAMSVTSQFLSYQIRLGELFVGKRLGATMGERNLARARLLAWNGAMYGAPMSLGATGLPIGDFLRQKAMERGYEVGNNWISSLVMEGIPSWTAAMITGKGDVTQGNWYNIGDRYGSQGFETIREALRGDKTMWELIGGASWSTFKGAFERSDGLVKAFSSMIRGDRDQFPLKLEDFVDPLREISSVDSAFKAYGVWNTGRWLSKNGNYLDNQTVPNAAFMTILGLSPQGVVDSQLKQMSTKTMKEYDKEVLKQFTQEVRRALIAADNNNKAQYTEHMKRAYVFLEAGGYPEKQKAAAIAHAMNDNRSMIERINESFFLKDAPDAQADVRQDALRKLLQRKQGQ